MHDLFYTCSTWSLQVGKLYDSADVAFINLCYLLAINVHLESSNNFENLVMEK